MSDAICVRCETRDCGTTNSVTCLARQNIQLNEEVSELETAVFFFASVIKSGEEWSDKCEAMMNKIKGKL